MRVRGRHYRSIWIDASDGLPRAIDQTLLPQRFETRTLPDVESVAEAIRSMRVRGAPLIGAAAAIGIVLALREDPSDPALERAAELLLATRPTAVNLRWAVERMRSRLDGVSEAERASRAAVEATAICEEDVEVCEAIGRHGLEVLESAARSKAEGPLNVLTHCNAGWLATVDWGTALAPIYKAHDAGLPIHVWVDETRPRNQGAGLTAFELREHGVPHTVVVDSAGGYLMQRGMVDLVLVGSDRTTSTGDVCNKIGTYPHALAARANRVPFYVCVPCSTIDWSIEDGVAQIPIEERDPEEVRVVRGSTNEGETVGVALFERGTPALNPAFDVTPADLVSGLITEHGVYPATAPGLAELEARLGSAPGPGASEAGAQRGVDAWD